MLDVRSLFEATIPVLEIVVRGSATFVVLLVLMRMVGQREAGRFGIADILLVVLVAEAAAPGLYGGATSITDSVVLVVTILAWSVALDAVTYRWPRVEQWVKARPKPLIRDGVVNRRVLRRELMTREEVLSQLRLHGIEDPVEVARAYIEPNGRISVLRRDAPRSLGRRLPWAPSSLRHDGSPPAP
jgi:uncharacterized membrane protein YcaP (DUF421 family)